MANNRMWLVHRLTGKKLLLAKHNGNEWWRYHDDLGEWLDAFLEDPTNASEAWRFNWGGAYAIEFEEAPGGPPEETIASDRAEYEARAKEKA